MSNSRTANVHPDGTLIIVSGPSGAGKTTLVRSVCDFFGRIGNPLHFSVSHTTRMPRDGENDGIDYHYVSQEEFTRMVECEEFIEWAHVHGNMYGTSRTEVERRLLAGQDVILDIDVQGAKLIAGNRALKPRSVSVFVFAPSFEELEHRIRARALNTEEEIQLRLRKAWSEIEDGLSFYDYVIINDDVEIAGECLKAAVLAKKLKSGSVLENLRERALRFKEENRGRVAGRS